MPRYIDADELLEAMRSNMDMQELYLPIHFIDLVIDEMPTADVEPVRHGRWIHEMVGYVKCSVCNDLEEDVCAIFYNFCPNCGAKMDGGDEDETDV